LILCEQQENEKVLQMRINTGFKGNLAPYKSVYMFDSDLGAKKRYTSYYFGTCRNQK